MSCEQHKQTDPAIISKNMLKIPFENKDTKLLLKMNKKFNHTVFSPLEYSSIDKSDKKFKKISRHRNVCHAKASYSFCRDNVKGRNHSKKCSSYYSIVVPVILIVFATMIDLPACGGVAFSSQHHPKIKPPHSSHTFDSDANSMLRRTNTVDLSGREYDGRSAEEMAARGDVAEESSDVLHTSDKDAAAAQSGTKVRDGIVQRVPPSRPAPMYDKPMMRPTFDNSTDTKVLAAVGQTAYLHCRVKHLGDRVVTWIRKHDVHVLTVALFTYTTDARFTALHSEASNDWTLRIASSQVSDSGTYECQVSTEPSISRIFQLQVVESRAHIDGPKEIHMMSGSNINLTCEVTGSPEPPQYIYWYSGTTLINYSERGGISVVTDKRTRTSRLVVSRATLADSGNYTCAPANAEPFSVSVYILNGEHPAAMQGGKSTSAHCLSRCSVAIIAILVALKMKLVFR